MRQMRKVIGHYLPRFTELMSELTDERMRRNYKTAELVTAGIAMFLFKETSRNAFNNDRTDKTFRNNYFRVFGLRLPHMDTVEDFLRKLPADELDHLKATLLSGLIEQKVLHRFKLLGKHFMVAIDGTGVNSYEENDEEQSRLSKTSKNGTVTYCHHVVEARLVTFSGLSLSLASEWVANEPGRNFDKQDCEQKAFERLAQKLKKYFPRLPLVLLVDGLYPNKTFMQICHDYGWAFVAVLKDKSLKTLHEDIQDVENKHRHTTETCTAEVKGKRFVHCKYEWISEPLDYAGHTVYWLSCIETVIGDKDPAENKTTRFVFLSNLAPDLTNVRNIIRAGRTRWKIENEGFNTLKNGGYSLGHQFSRKSFACYKQYYQCMQIAHTINQLTEHTDQIANWLAAKKKLTIKHLWKDLLAYLKMVDAPPEEFELPARYQIRLAG